jgi:hypothetical protein
MGSIAALLLREKWIERSDIGLSQNETYIDFATFDSNRIQEIADFVVNRVRVHILKALYQFSMMLDRITRKIDKGFAYLHFMQLYMELVLEDEGLPCQYIGGQVINLPKWFLYTQGHDLEVTLKNVFHKLRKFQKEPDLKMEIIAKVIDDVPSLIPNDFVHLFKEIQNI